MTRCGRGLIVTSVISEWQKIPETQVVRATIGDFEKRLATTVRVRGDHFE